MSKLVSTVIKDRICYIEMQNADHFNCLSEEMCHELIDSLQYGYKQECVGIVIKAQCKKGVWSAGHDIRELPQDGSDPLAYDVPMEKLLRKVQETPIPVIACVSGSVWGGACDLCLSCDMIVRLLYSNIRHHACENRYSLQCLGYHAFHQPTGTEQGT